MLRWNERQRLLAILLFIIPISNPHVAAAFSEKDVARRDFLWKIPVGAVATYGYGRLLYNALSVQDNRYPAAHEDRTSKVIAQALTLAVPPYDDNRPMRVLEVGIGSDCRLIRRGLYDEALLELSSQKRAVEITGIDLKLPKENALKQARQKLARFNDPNINLNVLEASITNNGNVQSSVLSLDGYFDAIVCCLVMCSVDDPAIAALEMKRILRAGGTLAYVEHVAVDPQEPFKLLEFQQVLLDPLQQTLADNCHLHRYTEATLFDAFGVTRNGARLLQQERFLVDSMWPVSCQACGVIQKL